MKAALRSGGLDVQIVPEGWSPRRLYDLAIELRDTEWRAARRHGDVANAYDEVWVVSDVDEFVTELQQILPASRASGIRLAITNPCFEAWLSMHVDGSAAKLDRHQAQSRAKRQGLVDPNNPKHIYVDKLVGKFDYAARNARMHAASHQSAATKFPHDVPASDVDLLVDRLRQLAQSSNPDLVCTL